MHVFGDALFEFAAGGGVGFGVDAALLAVCFQLAQLIAQDGEVQLVGLRRRDGIARDEFSAASGFALDQIAGAALRSWIEGGLATDDGRRVRLTREGLLVSDALWSQVLRPA